MEAIFDWVLQESEQYFLPFLPESVKQEYEEDPQLFVYGIAAEDTAVGAAAVSIFDTRAILEYVYIAPDYRGLGLFDECMENLGYSLWMLHVDEVSVRYIPEDYARIHEKMQLLNARIEKTGSGAMRFTLADIKDNPALSGDTPCVTALAECTKAQLDGLYRRIRHLGADLIELPLVLADYELACSCVYIKQGEAVGLLLVEQSEDGVYIPFFFADTDDVLAPLLLVRFALSQGLLQFPEDTEVTLRTVDEKLTKLLVKLTGKAVTEEAEAVWPLVGYNEKYLQYITKDLAASIPGMDLG